MEEQLIKLEAQNSDLVKSYKNLSVKHARLKQQLEQFLFKSRGHCLDAHGCTSPFGTREAYEKVSSLLDSPLFSYEPQDSDESTKCSLWDDICVPATAFRFFMVMASASGPTDQLW